MPGVTPARSAALAASVRTRSGQLGDRAFEAAADHLDPRDRAWARELVYGVARLRGRLDYLLARFVRGGLDRLDPLVLDILRLGAYQLLEMDSVPAYAAVSQSVEQARAAGVGRAAGLVNGVLQSLKRGWRSVEFPQYEDDPLGHLSTWGSHPRWLAERWVGRWGGDATRSLVEANNTRPELYIRPFGMTSLEAVERLVEAGIQAGPVAGFPDSVRIISDHGPADVLRTVPAVVQDPAAAMVVRYAGLGGRARVVDLSAAPGGKSIGLADDGANVIAMDLSFARLARLRENVSRLGARGRVHPLVADGRAPPFEAVEAALLDAPCTGTGTFRRHPDGRWRVTEADLHALVELQRQLLTQAASIVEVGGILVYSTCSLEPEENEMQIDWLLAERSDFRPVAPDTRIDGTMMDGAYLRVLPQRHGVDGAFAARLERFD